MKLIDKDALVAEIKELQSKLNLDSPFGVGGYTNLSTLLDRVDTFEVKEVDLQSEIDRVWDNSSDNFLEDGWKEFEDIAKHFFELGLSVSNKAQKGE